MANDMQAKARQARTAAQTLATADTGTRNQALEALAAGLRHEQKKILDANEQDVKTAEDLVAKGELEAPLLKRLKLAGKKFDAVLAMVHSVKDQADPLGRTRSATEIGRGLRLFQVSVPIGVIGVIFESRPDALVQIAALCLKSGNAVLLKGGREAAHTNRVLADVIAAATAAVDGIPDGWIALMETREDVNAILSLDHDIDLIIPRGSNEFVRYIMDHTNIPVMGHADGICHVYVDAAADLNKAVRVAVDAKTQYVSVCNAAETLLIHESIAADFLNQAAPALKEKGVTLRGDRRTCELVAAAEPATDEDWGTEYLDYILAVKIVDSLDAAVQHINRYGSHHTDTILTEDKVAARQFLRAVDSSSVMHNASTRFADGFRYGLGAEVGISTSRLHSRGPVGLEGLTIYKYIVEGDGHCVDDFEGETPTCSYTHQALQDQWPQ